jgi:hypothetical protein
MTTKLLPLLTFLASIGTIQAADKIRYAEIPTRLAPFGTVLEYRGFTVTTLDGKEHSGRRLRLESDHVRIFQSAKSWEDLSSEQISRIEIRQAGRFFHHVPEGVIVPLAIPALACSDGRHQNLCFLAFAALFSPLWAYPAATTPFFLAADGVAFLIPPKVYEIVH